MNTKRDDLRIELIDSEEAFLAIEDEWDLLIDKNPNSTFFATYLFVYTAWKNFRNENDQLFILLVRRGTTLVGIAPFRIQSLKAWKMRLLKVIRFIADWGGGDKPSIVTMEEPELVWGRIFQYLDEEYTQWDMIYIAEQPANSPILNQRLLANNNRHTARIMPEFTSFYVSMNGTWEDYLKTRGKNTLDTWKRNRKKLFNLPESVIFHSFEEPDNIPDALKRFIAIEQSGWKKNCDFSVGGSEKNKRFYEELLVRLARKNMVAIYFLTIGTTDIASIILYMHNSTVYMAHITFNPMYAKYSPGIILNAEIIKTIFSTHFQEYDFLVFQRGDEKNSYKKKWSTGTRQTITIQVYKKSLYMNMCVFLYTNGQKFIEYLPQKATAIS